MLEVERGGADTSPQLPYLHVKIAGTRSYPPSSVRPVGVASSLCPPCQERAQAFVDENCCLPPKNYGDDAGDAYDGDHDVGDSAANAEEEDA